MDSSPKSAEGEGNSKETPLSIAKQKLGYFGKTEHTAVISIFKYLKDIVKKKKEITYEDLDEVFSEQVERETIENLYEWFEENKPTIETFMLSPEICQTVDGEEEDSDSDAKPLKLAVKKGEESKVTFEEEEKEASDSKNRPLKLSANKRNSKKKDDGSKHGCGKNIAEKDQAKSLSDDDEMYSSPKSTTKPAKGEGNPTETPVTSGAKLIHNSYMNARMYYEYQKDVAEKKKKITYVDLDEEILFPKPVKLETFTEIYKWYELQIFEDQIVEAALETCKKVDAKGEDCDLDGKPLKIVKKGEKRKVTIEEEEKEKVDAEGEDSKSDAYPLKLVVKKGEKSKVTVEEQEESDSENKPPKLSARKRNLKKKADGSKLRSGKNVAEKNQDMDSPKSVTESAKEEGSSKRTPVTSAKRKRFTSKKKVHDSKLTTTSLNHTDHVVKEGACPEEVDPTLDRSQKLGSKRCKAPQGGKVLRSQGVSRKRLPHVHEAPDMKLSYSLEDQEHLGVHIGSDPPLKNPSAPEAGVYICPSMQPPMTAAGFRRSKRRKGIPHRAPMG